jgi:hypothetical protein
VLVARVHSDPQDTTPHMTRLPAILVMSRLKVLTITSLRCYSLRVTTIAQLMERPAGFEPAFTSFVAKAIHPLWHERSNCWSGNSESNRDHVCPRHGCHAITPFPDLAPAQRVERCSLRLRRSVSTAHTRLAKTGGACRICPDRLLLARQALS